MNIALQTSRPARPFAPSFYFTDTPPARTKTSVPSTIYGKVRTRRVPYATALYAAAVAALLSACAQSDVERVAPDAPATIRVSEAPSDMPEVVITATRERPKANG